MRTNRWLRSCWCPLAVAALALPSAAGEATLSFAGGVLGSSVQYTLAGDAGEIYALLLSFQAGPTPLAIVDPLDPRSLALGLDLLSLLQLGVLAPGSSKSFALPADPALAGLALHAQFVTLPGANLLVDEVSSASAFKLALHGQSQTTLGSCLVARQGHTASVLSSGRVLVAGGDQPDAQGNLTPLSSVEVFDNNTQSFSLIQNALVHARSTHTATRLVDGRILLLGGYDATKTVRNTGEIFDPLTNTSSPIAPMSVARTQHTATLLADGRVFVAGGSSKFDLNDVLGSLGQATAKTETYNPATNSWSSGPNLPLPLIGHGASLLGNGQVLVSGGVTVTTIFGLPVPAVAKDCRRFNPPTNAFVSTAPMLLERVYHGQATLADGRALVVGGADGDFIALNFFTLASCARYDASSNSWSNVGALAFPRAYPNLVELGAGAWIVAGGLSTIDVTSGSGTPEQHLETSSASLSSWVLAGQMLLPREVGRSVAIDAGVRVLTVGSGDTGGAGVDLSAELLTP